MKPVYVQLGSVHFNGDDKKVIVHLARELTGTHVSEERNALIFLNVSNRLQETNCQSLTEYLRYIHLHEQEVPYLLSALTIHTTGWFREPNTFDQFQLIATDFARRNPAGTFKLLSIGCSSGEEVYSYAFILEELKRTFPQFDYSVTGIDIDPISLNIGRKGTYPRVKLDFVEERWRHLARRRIMEDDSLKVEQRLISLAHFRSANILHFQPMNEEFDFISCRNILIYFDKGQIDSIVGKVVQMLRPGGHFCTGVSETGTISRSELRSLGSTIFQLKQSASELHPSASPRRSIGKTRALSIPSDTIIVIDDDQGLAEVYERTIKGEFANVISAKRYEDALNKMMLAPDAFVVVDYMLGSSRTGLDLLTEARSRGFKGEFILLSGFADKDIAMKALEIGCKDVLMKPCRPDELIALIKRYVGTPKATKSTIALPEILAFGSSTGGTEILVKILDKMPQPCPPVVVVQHIVADFAADFAIRLAEKSGLTLGKIVDGEILRPNQLYMALGDYHILVRKSGGVLRLGISHAEPVGSHRPSVDLLFDSLAHSRIRTVATILTGMGRDGAEGMLKLHERGAYTMAQDETSSTVFGMPGEAIKLGAVDLIGNPRQIQMKIHDILGFKKKLAS